MIESVPPLNHKNWFLISELGEFFHRKSIKVIKISNFCNFHSLDILKFDLRLSLIFNLKNFFPFTSIRIVCASSTQQ